MDVLDYLFSTARWTTIYFKWPVLADPNDNMVLELAVAAQRDCIVTFNTRHFVGVGQFGIQVATPFEFLTSIQASQ